ncbi:MAG: hypothetical protein H6888_08435 [Nitratireductor sp.]|nr:hypothetical protein [Nitratireductor sp.]
MQTDLSTCFPLRPARMHEASGPGAAAFAAIAAAMSQGNLLWVREGWRPERINPVGLSGFFDPSRLLLAEPSSQSDCLSVTEEALRDGSLSLVVAEVNQDIGLTAGRRLQLAAKTGNTTGLCLIPEGMGSNAAETRWHCAPVFDSAATSGDSTLQRWEIIKNKTGTLGIWHVRWDRAAHRLHVVPPAGKRPGSSRTPG